MAQLAKISVFYVCGLAAVMCQIPDFTPEMQERIVSFVEATMACRNMPGVTMAVVHKVRQLRCLQLESRGLCSCVRLIYDATMRSSPRVREKTAMHWVLTAHN